MRARVCRACSWRSAESYRRRCPLTFATVSSYHPTSHPSIPRMNCKEGRIMSTSTNEAIYRRLIEEGFNQGNLAVCDEIVAAGALRHQRGGGGGGAEGAQKTIKNFRSGFAGFPNTNDEVGARGDKVWGGPP